MFGTLLTPLAVQAGFITSLFVDEVYAENAPYSSLQKGFGGENSQTIALLQANVSSSSVIESKAKPEASEVPNLEGGSLLVADNALVPTVGPLSGTGGPEMAEEVSADDISVYVIRKNDSLSQIAEMYDVSVNTILWANDMKKGDKLVEGDLLFILPISGIKHTVTKGQTLKGIANLYKVDPEDVAVFNSLPVDAQLAIGDELLIPEGEMPNDTAPSSDSKKSTTKTKVTAKNGSSKVISGYYINPVPELKRKSQGIHDKNAVDLAAPTGTRILASAPGTVLIARNGSNGGYGNMVIIQHPNGTKTLYAHMSSIATHSGATVDRGQVIGYVGSTGRSTGPHLHFEVHGAKNPGADWTWAKQ